MSRILSVSGVVLCAVLLVACSSGSGSGSLPHITSFTAAPPVIAPGASALLGWTATDVTAASLSPGVGLVTGTSSSVSPSSTTTYTLTVSNSNGTDSAQVVVIVQPAPDTWRPRASLSTPRSRHTATLLTSGEVLVAGGAEAASAEVYDPATDTWHPTGPMTKVRHGHAAALLPSGRVLVVGDDWDLATADTPDASAEIYDPATNGWASAPSMNAPHLSPAATGLASGQVLVLGMDESWRPYPAPGVADLFDPASDEFALTDDIPVDRLGLSATALNTGKVLVAGGRHHEDHATSSATLFDPTALPGSRWTETGPLSLARMEHTATRLLSGDVMVAGGELLGGSVFSTASAEVYGVRSAAWADAGRLSTPRTGHSATLLSSGRVIFAAGRCFPPSLEMACDPHPLATAETFEPVTASWAVVAPMALARYDHTATLLPSGRVLVVGGAVDPDVSTSSVEEYTP